MRLHLPPARGERAPAAPAPGRARAPGGSEPGTLPSPAQAREISAIMQDLSGVAIDAGKIDFLALRAGRRLRATGHSDFASYLQHLRSAAGTAERQHLAEALVTHTTSFFREPAHFDWLAAEGLPALIAGGAGQHRLLTVWSAACSTGAEMWSAAMVLDELAAQHGVQFWSVLGTDISRRILRRAATATFAEDEIAGTPEHYRRRYLLRSRRLSVSRPGGQRLYRIVPELRSRAQLAWCNLAALERGPAIAADVALLRNVLIYFPLADQRRIALTVAARLRPGGYLITGHAEAMGRGLPGLRQIAPSIHLKE